MAQYKITSFSYQPIKESINGKSFVIPQKPYSVNINLSRIPESLQGLVEQGIIVIEEIKK